MRKVRPLQVIFLWILAAIAGPVPLARATPVSDYEHDLQEINERLSSPAADPLRLARGPALPIEATRAATLAEKAFLTQATSDLIAARKAMDEVLAVPEPLPTFIALRGKLLLQLHEVRAVQADLDWLQRRSAAPGERAQLQMDLALEAGDFDRVRALCTEALQKRRDWAVLSRLARLATLLGHSVEADTLYQEAEDNLTAKQMRAFAWLEVQRGRLQAVNGRWTEAEAHYVRAERAYSGLWWVASNRAEAAGAQGRTEEAIACYQTVIAATDRPELCQALGDLYRYLGQPAQAKHWHERAFAGYRASAERGEALYLHHLAEFYADVRGDGPAAREWAQRDFDQRPGPRTRQLLAWSLYRCGAREDAYREMNAVLATGLQDAHLFQQAARVSVVCGRDAEAKSLFEKAASLNPRYEGFHVHP